MWQALLQDQPEVGTLKMIRNYEKSKYDPKHKPAVVSMKGLDGVVMYFLFAAHAKLINKDPAKPSEVLRNVPQKFNRFGREAYAIVWPSTSSPQNVELWAFVRTLNET